MFSLVVLLCVNFHVCGVMRQFSCVRVCARMFAVMCELSCVCMCALMCTLRYVRSHVCAVVVLSYFLPVWWFLVG